MNPLYCDWLPFVEFSDEQDVEDHDDDENLKIHNIIHILVRTKYRLLYCYINVNLSEADSVDNKENLSI